MAVTSEVYCESLKDCVGPFRTKYLECWYLVVFLHDSACLHTAAYPNLTLSDYHLFTVWSTGWNHSASTIMSWWKVSKHGWVYRPQTSMTQAYKTLFPETTGVSIPTVTTLRSSLSMYIFFTYN
jgi:hypothetical protein